MFSAASGKQIFSRPLLQSVSLLLRFVHNWLHFLGTAKHLEEEGRQILVNKIITGFLRKKMVEISPLEIFHPTYVLAMVVPRFRPLPWALVHGFEKE